MNKKITIKNSLVTSVLVITMVLNIFTSFTYAEALPFTDVKEGQWFYSKLQFACDYGIINGFDDGTFKPQDTLTRQQYIKILVMIVDSEFEPVMYAGYTWATPYIKYASELKIITGDKINDKDYWNKPILREEVALYTYNAYNVWKTPERIEEQKTLNMDEPIKLSDFDQISPEARMPVEILYLQGIINGYDDGTYKPKGILTRAEATSLIYELKQHRFSDMYLGYVKQPIRD